MNFLQRWFTRLHAWIDPRFDKFIRTAGGSLERAEAEILDLREKNSARRQRIAEEQQEIRECLQMLGPQWGPDSRRPITAKGIESLREAKAPAGVVACYERLWELELALEDRGWIRELTVTNFEFSLFGVHRIIALCRLYKIKNPLIRRGIQICACYVFGRGFSISSDDETENQILQDTFNDPRNAPELGHAGMVEKEEQRWTDGNLFLVCFRASDDGTTIFRQIDPVEVVKIITDPDDVVTEWYFHRRWMAQVFDPNSGQIQNTPMQAYYPAVGYEPPDPPQTIGPENIEVRWDEPVLHEKCGSMLKWQWGIPLAYPAVDYARAVSKLINNWCSIQEAMARFAWQVETQGGLPAIANLKQSFATTLASGDGSMYEQNPPPNAASTWISGPGNKLTMSKTSGMIDSPEIGRRVAHMVYMVFGLPETFFADASVGTVATATSLDRPTELKFLDAQEKWRQFLQRVCTIILDNSAAAPKGKLREARVKVAKPRTPVQISFPSILEHDIVQQINAIVAAGTLNGFEITGIDERVLIGLLLQELQVENWQEVLELMYPEDEYEDLIDRTKLLAKQQEDALEPAPAPAAPGAAGTDQGPTGTPTPAPAPPNPNNPLQPAQPHAPTPKKPKVKRLSPAEATKLERAVESLERAVLQMKAGKVA
jgi:hypothetical protein